MPRHRRDAGRKHCQRNEQERELRRVDVPLLILEDRIVELRIWRDPVEHRIGRWEICKSDVPRQEAFVRAERDRAEYDGDREEDERGRQQTRSRGLPPSSAEPPGESAAEVTT